MDFEIREEIRNNKYLYSYLREDSYNYKYLYRDRKYLEKINTLAREKYKITSIDKLKRLNNSINIIKNFMDMI